LNISNNRLSVTSLWRSPTYREADWKAVEVGAAATAALGASAAGLAAGAATGAAAAATGVAEELEAIVIFIFFYNLKKCLNTRRFTEEKGPTIL
jgi:hypothetical protein